MIPASFLANSRNNRVPPLGAILAMNPSAMYDVWNSVMYQDATKTVLADANADPVWVICDVSGSAPDLEAGALAECAALTISGSSRYLSFAGGDYYTLTWGLTQAAMNNLHNGVGGECISLFQCGTGSNPNAQYCLLSTCENSTHVGFQLYFNDLTASSKNNRVEYSSYDGAAPAALTFTSSDNALTANTSKVIGLVLDDAASSDLKIYVDGSLAGSGNKSSAFSTSNRTNHLRLGATAWGNNTLTGRWGGSVFFSRVLSDYERSVVVRYFLAKAW